MSLFRMARYRLSDLVSEESLEMIQEALNIRSIERVHLLMRQVTFEAMNIEIIHKLTDNNITQYLVDCVESLEEEAEQYFIKAGESWPKHAQAVSQLVKEDFEGTNHERKKRRRLKIPHISKNPFRNVILQHKLLLQCSHYMNESLRELDAKTPDFCFVNTKSAIRAACESFDKQAILFAKNHPQLFNEK